MNYNPIGDAFVDDEPTPKKSDAWVAKYRALVNTSLSTRLGIPVDQLGMLYKLVTPDMTEAEFAKAKSEIAGQLNQKARIVSLENLHKAYNESVQGVRLDPVAQIQLKALNAPPLISIRNTPQKAEEGTQFTLNPLDLSNTKLEGFVVWVEPNPKKTLDAKLIDAISNDVQNKIKQALNGKNPDGTPVTAISGGKILGFIASAAEKEGFTVFKAAIGKKGAEALSKLNPQDEQFKIAIQPALTSASLDAKVGSKVNLEYKVNGKTTIGFSIGFLMGRDLNAQGTAAVVFSYKY